MKWKATQEANMEKTQNNSYLTLRIEHKDAKGIAKEERWKLQLPRSVSLFMCHLWVGAQT